MQNTTVYISELRRAIASRRREALAALKELVAIDSGSYDAAGVDRVGDALEARWRAIGFSAESLPLPGFGDRRVFRKTLGGHGRVLILGHLDTVWPAGTVADWPYREEEGLAHGPGVGDMKSGLVMACEAVRALLETGFDGVGEIRHILVPDEELGSAASRAWIEAEAAAADIVLVLEPARASGAVVVGRGAVGAIIVRATGISAHTVNLAEGASALRALADRVAPLESLTDLDRGDIINVGVLKGGDARQVVPPSAEMHIDLRARTGAAAERLLSRVMEILLTPGDPRLTIEIGGGITRPGFPRGASAALYASAARAAAVLGIDYPAVESGGGSDGSFAAALGRPTLDGLGPVCFDSCSRRERIVVDSLFDRAAILAALIADLPNLDLATPKGTQPWA
jgi:glutamate carboxypeptidase